MYRKYLLDIALYTNGAFSVSEMQKFPVYYINEIFESITEKNEKEKEAINKSKSANRRTF